MSNFFEQASKLKLRYPTERGDITTDDLWDMPLLSQDGDDFSLNSLAGNLDMDAKKSSDQNYVYRKTEANEKAVLRFDVVKRVIAVKLEEIEAKENALLNQNKKDRIDAILADQEDEELKNMSKDELLKMRNNLK